MAATAQREGVLAPDAPSWPPPPTVTPPRRRWSPAAAGLAGVGVLVTAVLAMVGSGAVSDDPAQAGAAVAGSGDLGSVGHGYRSVIERYENAERVWTALASKTETGSATSAEALIRPSVQFADAVDQSDHDLLGLAWPTSMRGDVNALERDLATVSGDLRSIGGQRVSSMRQWVANVMADASASSVASHRLMNDLGAMTTPVS